MDKETFEKGLSIRKQVLGADFVDQAFAAADDFNRPMQELVTEYCWGAVWGRPGLDKKTRSFLNLAMLSALLLAPANQYAWRRVARICSIIGKLGPRCNRYRQITREKLCVWPRSPS